MARSVDTVLNIRLFGSPHMTYGTQTVRIAGPPKCWALLAYLLLHRGDEVPRKAIAFALWPDEPEPTARANLRRHLHLLVASLPPAADPWILSDAAALRWNDRACYRCDALELPDDVPEGELLPDESGEWVEAERARLSATVAKRLLDAVLERRARSQFDEAIVLARRLLDVDPFREDVMRLLMSLHVERGDASGALARFSEFESRLRSELEAAPSAETLALATAIRAGDAPALFHHNLPRYETAWIDACERVSRVAESMQHARLVTLVGAGGIGKTRLAVEAAGAQLGRFPDGVVFVDLAPLTDPDSVLQALVQALGAPGAIRTLTELSRYLRAKSVLVLLDNCEHVLRNCSLLCEHLVQSAGSVRMLATSREPLGVAGEILWHVPALTCDEGVQLFEARLSALGQPFAFTDQSAARVMRICARLDGIPLAVELAAGRAQSMALADIEDNLEHRFELLASARANRPARQETLRGSIEWSFGLLDPQERAALGRLCVFAADFSIDAASAACSLTALSRLVEKSMLHFESRADRGRYRLLESVRMFAAEATPPDQYRAAQRSHAMFYSTFLRTGKGNWIDANQIEWIAQVEQDLPNIDAALRWSLEREPVLAAEIVCALWRWFEFSGRRQEGFDRVTHALEHARDDAARAELLLAAGNLLRALQRPREALAYFEQLQALAERLDKKTLQAEAFNGMGLCSESIETLQRGLELAQRAGDERMEGMCLFNIAHVYKLRGDAKTATSFSKRGLAIVERVAAPSLLAVGLYTEALHDFVAGDYEPCEGYLERSLALWRRLNHRTWIAEVLHDLGSVASARRDPEKAWDLYAASLRRSHEIGHDRCIAQCLEGLADILCDRGNARVGAMLLGGARRLRCPLGSSIRRHIDAVSERITHSVGEAVGPQALELLMHDGGLLPVDDLVDLALTT